MYKVANESPSRLAMFSMCSSLTFVPADVTTTISGPIVYQYVGIQLMFTITFSAPVQGFTPGERRLAMWVPFDRFSKAQCHVGFSLVMRPGIIIDAR